MRIDRQRGVEIGNGVAGLTALEIEQSAAVEGIGKAGTQPQRLVAILRCAGKVADHGPCPAAIVKGFDIPGVETERLVEIPERQLVGALAGMELSALVPGRLVGRIGRDPAAQRRDRRIIERRRGVRRRTVRDHRLFGFSRLVFSRLVFSRLGRFGRRRWGLELGQRFGRCDRRGRGLDPLRQRRKPERERLGQRRCQPGHLRALRCLRHAIAHPVKDLLGGEIGRGDLLEPLADQQALLAGGDGDGVRCGRIPVSYTHLDVYKRQRQRVEIVKAILRGAQLLILDEPTSNLSPPEVAGLLSVIRRLRENGRAVIFISHKLAEVIEICDEVVVLRDGAVSGRASVADVTRESLARMMVERDLSAPVTRAATAPGEVTLSVQKLSCAEGSGVARLDDVSFEVRAGEILAVAGVDGNGQAELLDTLAGILPASSGCILLCGRDITLLGASRRLAAGVAYIPVDRGGTSLVPGMTIADNLAMRDFDRAPLSRGPFLSPAAIARRAVERMAAFDIRAASADVPARTLSGGNQQKIVLAREIGRRPRLLLAFQPTWGLDPGAARFVIEQLLALRDAGGAILYVSAELEEVLTLGDRIAVMSNGRLSEPVARADVDVTRIGLLMAGAA